MLAPYMRHRMGLGAPRGVGDAAAVATGVVTTGTISVAGQTVNANTLATVARLDPATVLAQGQAAGAAIGAQLGASAKATWDAQTTPAANAARQMSGAVDAIDLASKGYDPNNQADNAKLVGIIAGALAFIPVAGPFLSGALVLLYAIGVGLSKILEDVGLIGPFGCFTSGNWTPKEIFASIAAQGESDQGREDGVPPMPAGSFASLVMPALAKNATDLSNCNKNSFSNQQVLAAIAQLWNANAVGPPITVYVPSLVTDGSGQIFAEPKQSSAAFMSAIDARIRLSGIPFSAQMQGVQLADYYPTFAQPPFLLQLNGSTLLGATPKTSDSASKSSASTAAATAGKTAAVVGGGLALGTVAYSYATGTAINLVVKHGWAATQRFWNMVVGEVEHLGRRRNPIFRSPRRRRRR